MTITAELLLAAGIFMLGIAAMLIAVSAAAPRIVVWSCYVYSKVRDR